MENKIDPEKSFLTDEELIFCAQKMKENEQDVMNIWEEVATRSFPDAIKLHSLPGISEILFKASNNIRREPEQTKKVLNYKTKSTR